MKRITTAAKASLTSKRSMSPMDIPALRRTFSVQAVGPVNMIAGSLPIERSEEHTSELQSHLNLVCRLLLEKKKRNTHMFFRFHTAHTPHLLVHAPRPSCPS